MSQQNKLLENRREILFLYDASYCNPNGDPSNENKPRVNPDTQVNLVTDVRMKRTIRDFLYQIENKEIFVRSIYDDENNLQDGKARARNFLETSIEDPFNVQRDQINQKILSDCIDVRLFGAVIPLELKVKKKSVKGSITHTGPVQFKMGKSLHKVSVERIKGTGAFAASEGKKQQTFRVEYVVPYSLISFYGIVNEFRAKDTLLSEADVDDLYKGIWVGTKHLISRSKSGITPRLLIIVNYNPGTFQISDLDQLLSLESDKDELQYRTITDFEIKTDRLLEVLEKHKQKIRSISYQVDENTLLSLNGSSYQGSAIADLLETTGIKVEHLDLE